ncbi:unnamed protein product [Paramecium pentaurelia]|uniref:60S ribosomal protein L29 n=1 Tax=Paramecium pentaurelia TaxID=43138 RepID=A0A8S1T1L2_9CILI|nr:unnamed protein product [Paramecium pentaurelia]
MAKSKNATSHHNARKHHRNGIKKLPNQRYRTLKGCNQRFAKNRRFAIKNDPSIKKNKSLETRLAKRKGKKNIH